MSKSGKYPMGIPGYLPGKNPMSFKLKNRLAEMGNLRTGFGCASLGIEYRSFHALIVQPEPEGLAHSAHHSGEGIRSRDSRPGFRVRVC